MIAEILKTGNAAPQRTAKDVMFHVVEEIGEMSTALHRPEKTDEDFLHESADAIIAIVDAVALWTVEQTPILGTHLTYEELNLLIQKRLQQAIDLKVQKWSNNVGITKQEKKR